MASKYTRTIATHGSTRSPRTRRRSSRSTIFPPNTGYTYNDERDRINFRHRTSSYTSDQGLRLAHRHTIVVFKLALGAERKWRRLNGHNLIAKVIEGVKFTDREMKVSAAAEITPEDALSQPLKHNS